MDEKPSLHVPSERESVIEAARAMEGKSPRERMAMFIDLLETEPPRRGMASKRGL